MTATPITFREFPPCRALQGWVDRYWRLEAKAVAGARGHRVLPDGCLDIVFDLGPAGPAGSGSSAYVVGTMTRPVTVRLAGRVSLLGVRFRPGRARAFLGLPAAEVTDSAVDLDQVWGRHATLLEEHMREATGVHGPVRVLEEELRARLALAEGRASRLEAAVDRILASRGTITVAALSALTGMSRQHLARTFPATVGVSPKMFCRVVRFRSVLGRRESAASSSWAELAAEAGYYDQAHLIADFRQFAGTTPSHFM